MIAEHITYQIARNEIPVVVELAGARNTEQVTDWYKANEEMISRYLNAEGAVYFRNMGLDSQEKFQQFVNAVGRSSKVYRDGNSRRAKHSQNVYNASEYDPQAPIHLHTEFSYSNEWPEKLFFCCQQPAGEGGETTVGSSREILERLPAELVAALSQKHIRYVRNMHSARHRGLGPSWQEAFETEDPALVEAYCRQNDMQYHWKTGGALQVIQVRPAVRTHPVTGEKLWFNQVDQFFPWLYDPEIYEAMLLMVDDVKEDLPMYATFGDGTPFAEDYLVCIQQVLKAAERKVPWAKGDLMVVENMIAHHGRAPFAGDRSVLVYMQ
jgi:alpha-ketoglutarate-dependent taurine dioxygenase